MATQFASLTPIVRFPAPKQPVRVAYSSQSSLAAIADALSDQPTPVVEATLEELSYTPLRELLAERNAFISGLHGDSTGGDKVLMHDVDRIVQMDKQLLNSECRTPEDAVMKLLALAQIANDHELNDGEADGAIADARRFLGIGYSGTLPDNPPLGMPESYNPFMRGPWLEWQKAYGRFIDADRVAEAYYDTKIAHLLDEGNVPPELWAISNANYSKRTDALFALIRTPAPGPTELAIKLKLFHAAEGQEYQNASELIGYLLVDARRFGRQGAYIQTDRALLAAIGQRAELEQTYPDGENDDEWARHARRIRANASLVIQPAATIEGILAKMRLAFTTDAVMAWAQHALTDASHPDFRQGLSESDGSEPLFWSAIEDLARLAGIDLGGPIVVPDASKHTAWLNERNDLLAAADRSEADVSDDVALTRINDLDGRIISTPAISADDVIAKLVMAMEVQAEGAELPTETAAALVREAKAHLGIGYVYSAEVAA